MKHHISIIEWEELCKVACADSDIGMKLDASKVAEVYDLFQTSLHIECFPIKVDGVMVAGAVCAIDSFIYTEPWGCIGHFYVSPDYRNTKIAVKLLKMCNDWFDENKVKRVQITPNFYKEGNDNAIKFFKKSGFTTETLTLIKEN